MEPQTAMPKPGRLLCGFYHYKDEMRFREVRTLPSCRGEASLGHGGAEGLWGALSRGQEPVPASGIF